MADVPHSIVPPANCIMATDPPLLELREVKKHFPLRRGITAKLVGWVRAVDGLSFATGDARTFGLVGESGCGKTTASQVILGIEPPSSGEVYFKGHNISQMQSTELRDFRSRIQAVFQDPSSSLDPRMRVGRSIAEPLITRRDRGSSAEISERVAELLGLVGLKREHAGLYPHEFSGGMRQRIAIARALAPNPQLVVLDEPVSSLDVSIRAQVMNLLKELQDRFGLGYVLIAHDLASVRFMSHRVGVMYVGKLVEEGDADEIFDHTLHPYTEALIQASLPLSPDGIRLAVPLRGEIPSPLSPPTGCRLSPRCAKAMPICSQEEPPLRDVGPGHRVACHMCR